MTVILRSYSDVKNICFTVFCIRSWDVINILTCPWALTLVQHPLITAERAVEPHGVVERGGELGPVLWVRQQRCAQQSIVWHISSNAAVQLHVTFPYANTQQKQLSMYHTSYSDLKHEARYLCLWIDLVLQMAFWICMQGRMTMIFYQYVLVLAPKTAFLVALDPVCKSVLGWLVLSQWGLH